MKNYTKLSLATLCFISSVPVFADGYKGEAPPLVPVSIPSFNGGFEFTLGALYMTPESSNTDYLGVQSLPGGGINQIYNWQHYNVTPDYDWGFVLGLGYVIPNTANDVKLDWMYFHNDYSDSRFILGNTNGKNAFFAPVGSASMGGSSTVDAAANMDYAFDAVDLTFGQYLNMGSRLQTRLFAGLRYMRLDSDLSTDYVLTTLGGTGLIQDYNLETTAGNIDSSFNGLGPLLGIKADYYLGAGFALSGLVDAALLVGQVSLDASSQFLQGNYASATGVFTTDQIAHDTFNWDSTNVVSPGFDAKFGLNYKYQFNNGTQLALELGYQVTKYLDVVGQMDMEDASLQTLLVNGITSAKRYSYDVTNFRLDGPYLTLNVKV